MGIARIPGMAGLQVPGAGRAAGRGMPPVVPPPMGAPRGLMGGPVRGVGQPGPGQMAPQIPLAPRGVMPPTGLPVRGPPPMGPPPGLNPAQFQSQ